MREKNDQGGMIVPQSPNNFDLKVSPNSGFSHFKKMSSTTLLDPTKKQPEVPFPLKDEEVKKWLALYTKAHLEWIYQLYLL